MQSGYTTTLLPGTLDPSKQARGNLGTFTAETRPSFASYIISLPNDPSSYLATWGWSYQTQYNGTWVNASSGNIGDITG